MNDADLSNFGECATCGKEMFFRPTCTTCMQRELDLSGVRHAEVGGVLDVKFIPPICKPTFTENGLFQIDNQPCTVDAINEDEDCHSICVTRESDGQKFRMNFVKPGSEKEFEKAEAL